MLLTSEPASGSEHGERGELHVVLGAEALRDPLADLLRRAVGQDAGDAQGGADDGQADAGVAPEELLHGDRDADAALVAPGAGEEVQRVDARLGRLLDDRPGGLLALVPLGGGRADDVRSANSCSHFWRVDWSSVELEGEAGACESSWVRAGGCYRR